MGDFRESTLNHICDVRADSSASQHGRYKHRFIKSIFDVRKACVVPRHFSGRVRISGINITKIVRANLCTKPLAIRFFMTGRVRRGIDFESYVESAIDHK